ncbi:MAG: hypothetical protein ABL907_12970, partial [Hyphomicrobium sp.]
PTTRQKLTGDGRDRSGSDPKVQAQSLPLPTQRAALLITATARPVKVPDHLPRFLTRVGVTTQIQHICLTS